MDGYCKFCNQKKTLIASHIIPKSFYLLTKYGGYRAITLATKNIDLIHYQNGLKEFLMCSDCDGSLGKLDAYAKKILFQEIPKHKFKTLDNLTTYLLQNSDFDYDKLRHFFISLVWRISVSSKFSQFSLGKYENIALNILKGKIADETDLFVPIVIRKQTQTPIDNVVTWCKDRVIGKHACLIRFPKYEIEVITNTKHSKNATVMQLYKSCLTRNEFFVIETNCATNYDIRWLESIIACLHQ